MSVANHAISVIRMNKALRNQMPTKFKFGVVHVAKSGSVYNENYLKSKFSGSSKQKIKDRIRRENRMQHIFNWSFVIIFLSSLLYGYCFIMG